MEPTKSQPRSKPPYVSAPTKRRGRAGRCAQQFKEYVERAADDERHRADEAARNENIGCAALVERLLQRTYPMDSAYEPIVAAIRARIA